MRLQPAVVLAFGDEPRHICECFVEAMANLQLPNGEPYPSFLHQIISVHTEHAGDNTGIADIVLGDAEGSIPVLFQEADVEVDRAFRDAVEAVHDRSSFGDLDFSDAGLDIDEVTRYYIVASACDGIGDQLFLPAMQLIHERHTRRTSFRVIALILLPGLFEGTEDCDRAVNEARAFRFLSELSSALGSKDGEKWGLRSSVINEVWLVDSMDQAGQGIGRACDIRQPLGEVLETMVSQSVFDRSPSEGGRVFSGFGLSRLVFPRTRLTEFLMRRLSGDILDSYVLRRPPLDYDDVVISTTTFTKQKLQLASITSDMQLDGNRKNIVQAFTFEMEEDPNAENFLLELDRQMMAYEDDVLPDIKRNLSKQAQVVGKKKCEVLNTKIGELIDAEEAGPIYTQAFVRELLDRSDEQQFDTKRGTEASYNLKSLLEEQRDNVFRASGRDELLEASHTLQQEIESSEFDLEQLTESRQGLEDEYEQMKATSEHRATIEVDDEEAFKEADAILERMKQVSQEATETKKKEAELGRIIEKMRANHEQLRSRIDTIEATLQGTEQRTRTTELVTSIRKREIAECKKNVRTTHRNLVSTEDAIDEIYESGQLYVKILAFVGLPIVAALAVALAILAANLGFVGYGSAMLWMVAAIASYAAGGGWFVLRQVLLKARTAKLRKQELERKERKERTDLLDAVMQCFSTMLELQVSNKAYDQMEIIAAWAEERLQTLETFVGELESAKETLCKHTMPDEHSIIATNVICADDYEYFSNIVLPSLEDEIGRFFSKQNDAELSSYLSEEQPAPRLLGNIACALKERIESGLSSLSIESLIHERYEQLSGDTPPRARYKNFLRKLHPLVKLTDSALKRDSYISQSYVYVGVEDAEQRSIIDHLEEITDTSRINLFTHRDPSRIMGIELHPDFEFEDMARYEEYKISYDRVAERESERTKGKKDS